MQKSKDIINKVYLPQKITVKSKRLVFQNLTQKNMLNIKEVNKMTGNREEMKLESKIPILNFLLASLWQPYVEV